MTRLALLLALAVPVALAQVPRGPSATVRDVPAERYHEGARAFVDGETERALAAVEAGLRAAPDDGRLRALRDLIQQEQEEQDHQRSGQDQDQQEGGEEGDGGEQDDAGERQPGDADRPPADDPEAEQDQTRTPPQDPSAADPESEQNPSGRQAGQGGATPEGQGEAPPGQMSRAQAERLLDAVGGEERLLLEEMQRRPTRGRRSEKDW